MSTDYRKIRSELRLPARIFHRMLPYYTEDTFRFFNHLTDWFLLGKWLPVASRMEERFIQRADGSMLRLCICRSRSKARSSVVGLLWLHGGGYAIGTPEQDCIFINRFVKDGSCVVIAPDYMLSTRAPYPAALEDSYMSLLWMKEHAGELGIRADQLFVGGDSAGGGLCAALCMYARDRKEVSVAFQMPLYPMLDDRMITPSSNGNTAPVWNSVSNRAAWRLYLSACGSGEVPAYAAPSRSDDYAGLPPTCTYVGTVDPFHDETAIYAEALKKHGVPVSFREFEGCFHGFDILCPHTRAAKDAHAFLEERFNYAKEHYFAPQPADTAAANI